MVIVFWWLLVLAVQMTVKRVSAVKSNFPWLQVYAQGLSPVLNRGSHLLVAYATVCGLYSETRDSAYAVID